MRCPACSDATLDRQGHCNKCGGVWLDDEVIADRVGPLAFTGGGYSERHCPSCDEKMDEPLIFDIPIDRCPAHGMWFDRAELDEICARSKVDGWKPSPAPKPEDSLRILVAAVRVWRDRR